MNDILTEYFFYSIATLLLASTLATVFTSLRFTGDAGVPRLIEREGKHTKRLEFWRHRWNLLTKAARLLLTLTAIATFILFYLALQECGKGFTVAALFLLSLLYMLVARIIPYVLSESYADRISLAALPMIGTLTLLLYAFVWPLQFIEDRLLHHAMSSSDEEDRPSTEDEIKSLIEETDEEALEEEEREIIRSVFEFGETIAREIMTPRIDIQGFKDTLTLNECIDQIKDSRHSRFPVYHENIDDVVGLLHVKELLRLGADSASETTVSQLAKKIDYVPETMPLNDLLQLMKKSHAQMVLVVDEYGGTEGLVTMEDVIEELVGEIEDEYDLKENELQRRPDGSVMVQARMPIYELNEELDAKLPENDEYDSLGGYIFSRLGRIPKSGETLEAPGYTLRIHSATQRQIQVVHMLPSTNVQ
ncbi:transporter associated domain-containing protein [Pontiella sulfatireligans]|uniref:Magnesium and cobalt efflux protein CorC n=1 Tax=Pontiella sulfatireligans TaxID=2750658 RepID=A0A6C2UM26_9BACT|nr:hemolysin family protein [Pontiella sulfatireligans]VGO20963.1 Magnesium and cobalt efflux protein CorC [Pontiella sulfatireligans]